MAKMVENQYGKKIYFEAAVQHMDNEIRERLSYEMAPCTEQEFFNVYCEVHWAEHGEEFFLNEINPQY